MSTDFSNKSLQFPNWYNIYSMLPQRTLYPFKRRSRIACRDCRETVRFKFGPLRNYTDRCTNIVYFLRR